MKYIIEFEDEPVETSFNDGTYYRCKQAMYLSLSKDTVNQLTPYTEPSRKDIEDEVWKLASKLIWTFTERECKQIFGMEAVYVPRDMPYSEAKSKYEVWKRQKEDEATMKEITALAEKIGIHKLYSMVKEIRGE